MTKSKIEWTDEVWNPVTGCSKVSDGCKNCYAERITARFRKDHLPWTLQNAAHNVVEHPERLDIPMHWKKPRRVFVNSMSDLFHEQVSLETILYVWWVMEQTPQHTYQILTKRPDRMMRIAKGEKPLPNVWLGVSVENQAAADERIPLLLQTPAAVRFLSCEPLLGPVDLLDINGALAQWTMRGNTLADIGPGGIHWVIVGGESGSAARPMKPEWARSLRDQCVEAGVPFFFKQWGEWTTAGIVDNPRFAGGRTYKLENYKHYISIESTLPVWREDNRILWDKDHIAVRVGKQWAGRLLDGHEWNEYPERGE
ncbi:MAG: phage Gp37/Gp68 family protein [Acidithiobacillus sp.]|nr:phage Gp37/Gp68 family protein [Acidithiobacillus sp.]